jgi:hypothetical protein
VAGITVRPYGASIGIRVNDTERLAEVQAIVRDLGWDTVEEEVVDHTMSIKFAKAAGARGIKHYNLLYHSATLLGRDLDIEPIYDLLKFNLPVLAASTALDRVLITAETLLYDGKAFVFPLSETGRPEGLISEMSRLGAESYKSSWLTINEYGEAFAGDVSVPIHLFAQLTQSRTRGGVTFETLSPGRAYLEFVKSTASMRTSPTKCFSALTELSRKTRFLQGQFKSAKKAAQLLVSLP